MPNLELCLLIMVYIKGVYTKWDVKTPRTLRAVPGSCLLIPCTFNYPSNKNPSKGIVPIWIKNFNTNQKTIYHPTASTDEAYRGRVEFLGDTAQKNCTLLIKDVKMEDAGFFHFRFEIKKVDNWMDQTGVQVELTDTPLEPAVVIPPKIFEGQPVMLQCSTPYVCPGGPINLEWENYIAEGSFLSKSIELDTSQSLMTQNLTTSFTWQENKKTITCAVTVGDKKTVSKIVLDVLHAPKDVKVLLTSSRDVIKQGDSVTLTCQVKSSNPAIDTYTWYKNGEVHSTGELISFNSISRNDFGEFQCKAENVFGKQTSEMVQLAVFSAYTLTDPSSEIREGERVTLTCDLPGFRPEEIHYSWFKNNVQIKDLSDRSLSFRDVKTDDAGSYFCIIQNDKGEDSSPPVMLNVLYAPKEVKVLVTSSRDNIKQGDSVTLTCQVNGSNPAIDTYTWYKNEHVHSTGELIYFRSISRNDSGEFRCEAENVIGKQTSEMLRLIVFPPYALVDPSSEVRDGERVTLTCDLPWVRPEEIHYSWFKNNVHIKDISVKSLIFHDVNTDDAGRYFCKVQNDKGEDSSPPVTLNVLYAPKEVKVLVASSSDNIKQGDSVTLTCQVNGSNPAIDTYTWYKNGQVHSTGELIYFRSISRNDSGEFRCEAENVIGKQTSEMLRLIVFSAYTMIDPSSEVREGENVNLTCDLPVIRPEEIRYSWFKNNALIEKSSVRSLAFHRVTKDDAGYYFCKIQNEKGDDSSPPVTLNVLYPPRTPTLTSFLETQRGRLAIIQCTVDSNPQSQLMLYKDGHVTASAPSQDSPNGRIRVASTWNALEMEIREVKLSDEGTYSCFAQNSIGNSTSSLHFVVETARIKVTPGTEIREGDAVTLTCLATRNSETGSTRTFTSWYKNGEWLKEDLDRNTLSFNPLSRHDAGSYYCKVQTSSGSSSSPSVNLRVLYPPGDLVLTSLMTTQGGQLGIIQCTVSSDPYSELFIYRKETLVAYSTMYLPDRRFKVSTSTNSVTLEILDVHLEDEGTYKCYANNTYGQTSGSLEFTAENAPRNIHLKSFLETVEGKVGSIHCTTDSYTPAQMYLYLENQMVASNANQTSNNERYSVSSSHNELRLDIKNVNLKDEGKYTCTSSNSIGSASWSIFFKVQNLRILVSPPNDILEGERVTFTCELLKMQIETVMYTWYKDSKRLQESEKNSLEIDTIKSSDSGYYHCKAQDSHESYTSPSVSLHVSYPPREPVMSSFWEAQSGDSGVIHCSVDSDPPSTLALYKGETIIGSTQPYTSSKPRMNIYSSYNSLKLEIRDVMLEDDGMYRCLANNSIGQSMSSINFTAQTIRILISPSPVVQEGDFVNMTCAVATDASQGIKYSLYKNGKLYKDRMKMEIQFKPVSKIDAGSYQCAVHNQHGPKMSPSIALHVLYAPTNVYIKSFLETQNGKVAIFLCGVDSDPPSEMSLYKDGKLLASSAAGGISTEGMLVYFSPNTLRLEITDVMSSDEGTYIFIAKNKFGSEQASTVLTVKGVRVTMSPSTQVTEGHLVTLTCEVVDNPQTVTGYTWYKNSRWFQDGSAGSLVFSGVRSSDAGSYYCTAHTSQGSLTSPPHVLHVPYQPRNLSMTSFFEMQERCLGVIICNVDSDPPSSLTMHHGAEVVASSSSLNSNQNMKISSSRNSLKLEIYDITNENQGLYECRADNSLGVSETSIVFSVQTAKIVFSPSSELYEGATVTITCHTHRNMHKNGTYTWYKNNNWLMESTTASIVLTNLSNLDTGSYHCLAKHQSRSSISPLVGLTVQYGPRNLVITSFIEPFERQRGILVCSVSSIPPSVLRLYRGDVLLTSTALITADQGHRFLFSSSYNYLKLEIRDVTGEDSGEYTCIANNTLGIATSTIMFTIKDGQLLVYKSITWVAIICILILLASAAATFYWNKSKEKYQLQADKDSIEMNNKEMTEISS
uniref:Ig-like domain-containing protein n=1 Tax=Leptobrachium leishanense TaxID=445787 RepID=A0A8C5PWD1_9ANUR